MLSALIVDINVQFCAKRHVETCFQLYEIGGIEHDVAVLRNGCVPIQCDGFFRFPIVCAKVYGVVRINHHVFVGAVQLITIDLIHIHRVDVVSGRKIIIFFLRIWLQGEVDKQPHGMMNPNSAIGVALLTYDASVQIPNDFISGPFYAVPVVGGRVLA